MTKSLEDYEIDLFKMAHKVHNCPTCSLGADNFCFKMAAIHRIEQEVAARLEAERQKALVESAFLEESAKYRDLKVLQDKIDQAIETLRLVSVVPTDGLLQ